MTLFTYHLEKRKGPKTERWGTPDKTSSKEKQQFLILTFQVCLVRYDSNHYNQTPDTPKPTAHVKGQNASLMKRFTNICVDGMNFTMHPHNANTDI